MFNLRFQGTTVIYCLAIAGWLAFLILIIANANEVLAWWRANLLP